MNIIVSPSTTSAFNLATEEYLFSKKGEDYLLLYLNDQSVIIGSNQAVVNEVDIDFCIDNDIRIIRRMSGGGAVYHDSGNFNYAFIRDKRDAPLSAAFLDPIVKVLHRMDIPVTIGKRKDLWLDGYKISGTASHISRGRELHHGTLLYDSDLEVLQRALAPENNRLIRKATASVPSPVINIRRYLAESGLDAPATSSFIEQFITRLLLYYGENEVTPLPTDAFEQIEQLQKDKYSSRSWNYRL
jgi:lipoate-protein ligase A